MKVCSSLCLAPTSKSQDQSNSKIKNKTLDRTFDSDQILIGNHKSYPNSFQSGPGFHSRITKALVILLINLGPGQEIQ